MDRRPCQGGSSNRTTTTIDSQRDNKDKEVMPTAAAHSSYCLFPEDSDRGLPIQHLHDILTAQPQLNELHHQKLALEVDTKASAAVQRQFPEGQMSSAKYTVPTSGPSVSPQVQHHGASDMIPHVQQHMASPVMNARVRLMHIQGRVAAACADKNGSRFVQQAIEVATHEEIIMVYMEITPCVRTLSIDAFGNHAVQKILEYGPNSCKRKLISYLLGHVLALSRHEYGCRVIQKVLEVGDHDQTIAMAKELGNKVLKCVRDLYANHVIQKCIECLPPKHIEFIFRNFCGKAKAMSTHPYGCYVIQRVLGYCDNPEIYYRVSEEIIESVQMLSSHQYGNYVVQHMLKHGSQVKRSTIVKKFAGHVVIMSYHKYASNVIEKCLTFGSQEDRHFIANEIIGAGGGQYFDHIMDMMIHPSANFVIQKLLVLAEEQHVAVLLNVAKSNPAYLTRYLHGRHVVAAIERFLSAKAGR